MAAENTCPYNTVDCPCTKDCPRHGKCCECVKHHKAAGNKLPACLRGIDWQRSEAAIIPQPVEQKTKPLPCEIQVDLRVQSYRLTVEGLMLYAQLTGEDWL